MHAGELKQALTDWGAEPQLKTLADAALWLAALDKPDADMQACRRHLDDIAAAAEPSDEPQIRRRQGALARHGAERGRSGGRSG